MTDNLLSLLFFTWRSSQQKTIYRCTLTLTLYHQTWRKLLSPWHGDGGEVLVRCSGHEASFGPRVVHLRPQRRAVGGHLSDGNDLLPVQGHEGVEFLDSLGETKPCHCGSSTGTYVTVEHGSCLLPPLLCANARAQWCLTILLPATSPSALSLRPCSACSLSLPTGKMLPADLGRFFRPYGAAHMHAQTHTDRRVCPQHSSDYRSWFMSDDSGSSLCCRTAEPPADPSVPQIPAHSSRVTFSRSWRPTCACVCARASVQINPLKHRWSAMFHDQCIHVYIEYYLHHMINMI